MVRSLPSSSRWLRQSCSLLASAAEPTASTSRAGPSILALPSSSRCISTALSKRRRTSNDHQLRAAISQLSFVGNRCLITTSAQTSVAEAPETDAAAVDAQPEALKEAPPKATPRNWTPLSQRVGLVGVKQGMISYFLPNGVRVPASVIQIHHNQIMQQIHFDPTAEAERKGRSPSAAPGHPSLRPYVALQIYAGAKPPHVNKRSPNKYKGIFKEFRVSPDALVPVSSKLSVLHFVPGQQIDISGKTKGKGFQGAMKRHGFKGLRASHGVSISHRSHGSTGQHQDPGRVFPGKKMAGRMGGKGSTLHNLTVLRIDVDKSLLFVKGNVPGPKGSLLYMTDARRSLQWKASGAFRKGKLRDGSLASGQEEASAYLPPGVDGLPFPAATKGLEKKMPGVIEVASL